MIQKIRLRQFRSYLDQEFSFSSGVNIISGPNASGKTNLLEAVMFICRGTSFRVNTNELIMHSKNWARVDAETDSEQRTVKLTTKPILTKLFNINNKDYRRLSAENQLPIVLFEPNDMLMLSGSPQLRRSYLDNILDQIKPGFKQTRLNYQKTLRQRNSLLKKGNINQADLFPWNFHLSRLGGVMAAAREELTLKLGQNINSVYQDLSNTKDDLCILYKPMLEVNSYESLLLKKLEETYELDLLRGFTGSGPHLEDFEILINGKSPLKVASRGETRTIIVGLKILEDKILQSSIKTKPIILLDDVFSELDNNRSLYLEKLLHNRQSLITTTQHGPSDANMIVI